MTILGISVLLTALSMLKGSHGWASTRNSAKGNGCSLEKYEGGDGTVNICKFPKTFVFFIILDSQNCAFLASMTMVLETQNDHVQNIKHAVLRKNKIYFELI